jgi:hypothetical protein
MFSGLWAPVLIALSYLILSDDIIPKEPIGDRDFNGVFSFRR